MSTPPWRVCDGRRGERDHQHVEAVQHDHQQAQRDHARGGPPGLRGSSPGYLQHQFLRRHGALETGETEVTLDLLGVPLGIVLKMAGMTGPQGRLPQLGDRLFIVTLGGRR